MTEGWGFEEGAEIAEGLRVVELLGGGSSYEAYLAWDDRLYALVVAKVLRPGVAGDPAARRRIAREAEALQALQHPVLPRCFGMAIDGERPHVVLEFLEGPRLSTLIRKQILLSELPVLLVRIMRGTLMSAISMIRRMSTTAGRLPRISALDF